MRKNYSFFNKVAGFVLAMAMMVGFTSCEDILGEWDRPAVKQAIETIVNVTGADPAEVTAALQAIVTDEAIAAAAAKGEPIKVTVTGSGVSTDATDKTITIPQKNGAEIEISFAAAPTGTDTNPLEFTASSGASGASSTSQNDLTIDMPTANGLVITIELPQTTVTLTTNGTSTVYKTVTAKTATNTLNVESGVTIEKLIVEGGNVVINGGKIENVKIADNQEVIFSVDGSSMETMEIGTGASVKFNPYQSEDQINEKHPKIKTVKGDEGKTAKFYLPRFDRGPKPGEVPAEEVWEKYGTTLKGIEKISNCKVLVEEEDIVRGTDFTNVLFDNCELNGNNYLEGLYYNLKSLEWPEGNTITFNNCTFNFDNMGFLLPLLDNDHNNAIIEFSNCTFKENLSLWQLMVYAHGNVTSAGTYVITIKFTDCKLGTADFGLDQLKNFIPYWAAQTFHSEVPDEEVGNYFINVIYQIGETKYIIDYAPGAWDDWQGGDPQPEPTYLEYNPE